MKLKKSSILILVLLLSTSLIFMSTESRADNKFGVRVGSYTDMEEIFVGAEVLSGMGTNLYFNPNIEYVFIENGDYMTFNLDLHYDVIATGATYLWLGGGLGVLYFNPEPENVDSETDVGVNLLAGLGLRTRGRIIPYIQAKAVIGDTDEFVLGVGIRF